MENLFAQDWWPIDLADAWVRTRDRELVERLKHLKGRECYSAVSKYNAKNGRRPRAGSEEWHALQEFALSGVARLIGRAFDTTENEQGQLWQQVPLTEIHLIGPAYHWLPSLPSGEDSGPCIWPVEEGESANRQGYCDVRIRRDDLIKKFPLLEEAIVSWEQFRLPMLPEGSGTMPLSEAAYFIASKGGRETFDLKDEAIWNRAFDELLLKIVSGEVETAGRPRLGRKEVIPGHAFVGVEVSYPYCDGFAPPVLCLDCYPYVDGDQWQSFNDKLYLPFTEPQWTHLEVKKEDIARLWPFTPELDSSASHPDPIVAPQVAKPPRILAKKDAQVRHSIDLVLRTAGRIFGNSPPTSRNEAVKSLKEQPGVDKMSETAVRDILSGTYEPMKKRRIKSPFANAFKRG
jgi:hypothetical protein